ncbi:hypothetical protein Cni_G06377 [Canna indica]|uniref:Uncharacterized protein n=1 Tax=Canna indica TaxID=4628 RepID=A0AAQ3JWF2_9LILI|nr:hypothetical protein Cni_G06377 [Canna indica]
MFCGNGWNFCLWSVIQVEMVLSCLQFKFCFEHTEFFSSDLLTPLFTSWSWKMLKCIIYGPGAHGKSIMPSHWRLYIEVEISRIWNLCIHTINMYTWSFFFELISYFMRKMLSFNVCANSDNSIESGGHLTDLR